MLPTNTDAYTAHRVQMLEAEVRRQPDRVGHETLVPVRDSQPIPYVDLAWVEPGTGGNRADDSLGPRPARWRNCRLVRHRRGSRAVPCGCSCLIVHRHSTDRPRGAYELRACRIRARTRPWHQRGVRTSYGPSRQPTPGLYTALAALHLLGRPCHVFLPRLKSRPRTCPDSLLADEFAVIHSENLPSNVRFSPEIEYNVHNSPSGGEFVSPGEARYANGRRRYRTSRRSASSSRVRHFRRTRLPTLPATSPTSLNKTGRARPLPGRCDTPSSPSSKRDHC